MFGQHMKWVVMKFFQVGDTEPFKRSIVLLRFIDDLFGVGMERTDSSNNLSLLSMTLGEHMELFLTRSNLRILLII